MSDRQTQEFTETGTIMTELVAKAHEARRQGRSRRDFFASTARIAGASVLGGAGIGLMQPIAARAANTPDTTSNTDTLADIFNIAATAELLATTFYFHALVSPYLPSVQNSANKNYFQAALSQEYEHLEFLKQNGGVPLVSQFYFPDNMFGVERVFYEYANLLEEYFISAYTAAALDFSGAYSSGITAASPTLIGVAVQIAGVESEHRALLRVAQGINPPNNLIAESALLTSVQGAAAPLTPFLQGGAGFHGPFIPPSIGDINQISAPYTPRSFKPATFI